MKLINSSEFRQRGEKVIVQKDFKKIKVDNKLFIYDCNSMALYEVTEKEYNDLDVKSICQDWTWFVKEANQDIKEKGYLCLNVTDECPLACIYCFVREHYKDITSASRMSYEDALNAIDYYQPSWPEKGCKIGFFGGEPLVNWELIYRITEFTQANCKNPKACSYHITTNGVLMTEEIAEYCVKHNFSFIVSLDGDEEDHNNSRPYREIISNSFKDTMRALTFLKNEYIKLGVASPVTIRSTFGKEGCDFVKRVAFLNNLMYTGFANHVSVEPATVGESCAISSFEGVTPEELRLKFADQYINAAKWFVKEVKEGRKPSLHHFEMPLQRLYDRDYSVTECGAGKGYVSVGKDGDVCACHRRHESSIGNIYSGIDKISLEKWLSNTLYYRINCPTCWQRFVCGGGCRCNSMLLNKNIHTPYWAECEFKNMQMNAVLYIISSLTENEVRLYSKYNRNEINPNKSKDRMFYIKSPIKTTTCNCKNTGECHKPIVSNTSSINNNELKRKPICGLKYCQGSKCPFSKCGKHEYVDFIAVMDKLIPENKEFVKIELDRIKK